MCEAFDGRVLSIAKLRVGQEAYQLSGVAQSLDDYYTGTGEAAGQWAGVGAERLGLTGEVDPDDLRAVLAGIAPGTGGLTPNGETIRPHPRRVPGFDLTFKAPKSVSVLYAVTDDPRVQHAIVEAGDAAVRAALGWVEREAIHVRRGNGDAAYINDLAARDPDAAEQARIRTLPASGAIAAMFRHRTSRAGDPLLHWHTLVANLAEGPDHRWTAIVHPDLYGAVRAAGEVFQTVLRDEVSARLGVSWRPGRHVPEIEGVPQGLLDVFSKRSREIEDWLDATGVAANRAGRQAAVLATRGAKPEQEHERFDTLWKSEAAAFGWGPMEAEALIASAVRDAPVATNVSPEWAARVARDLTEHDATFDRNALVQAVAARLDAGASMLTIERTVAAVLASPAVVPVGSSWTSAELVATERRFLTVAADGAGARSGLSSGVAAAALDSFPTIEADQALAVSTLASSTDAVSVLVGPAGTGKTFALDAVRVAFENAGFTVVGVAPSARAAHELQAGAHISSTTMHRLLGAWSRGYDLPSSTSVIVADEAAMAGTRELEAVVSMAVGAGGRVILVGDHHQLPEVTAGGGFAALVGGGSVTVATLTTNRRQELEWERSALADLRDGHLATAVAAYRAHDRVHAVPDSATMLTDAVARWSAARADGLQPVLIAGTNSTVKALNLAARSRLIESGEIGEPVGSWGGIHLAVGDQIVLRANDYTRRDLDGLSTPLLNGHTATIVGSGSGGVVARLHHTDSVVELDSAYLVGGVDYAYALTSHRAQGGTWDMAIAVGADGLYREAGYLALSRGRSENLLVLTHGEIESFDAELTRHDTGIPLPGEEPDDLDTELNRRLNQSRAKTLALTDNPHADFINYLAETMPLATLEDLAAKAAAAEEQASSIVGIRPEVLQEKIDRATFVANHIAVGQAVKPTDRNNIGTAVALDDAGGRVVVQFVSTEGKSAERSFRWDELSILEPRHPADREMPTAASQALESIVAEHREGIDRWSDQLARADVLPGQARVYSSASESHVEKAAARILATDPRWLTAAMGARPTPPVAARVWVDAVGTIAAYRSRHDITDDRSPLGNRPSEPERATPWTEAWARVSEARGWLSRHTTIEPAVLRSRTPAELTDRRAELDAILASAPSDQRDAIRAINGQLTICDTDVLLEALGKQGARSRWILEHWPHLVEATAAMKDAYEATPAVGFDD